MTRLSTLLASPIRSALLLAILLSAGSALAHPDHTGVEGATLGHWLSDPFHLGLAAAAGVLAFAAARALHRSLAPARRARRR